jgi:hypothetical protein
MAAKIVDSDAASIGVGTATARGKQHSPDKVDRVDRRDGVPASKRQTVLIVVEPVGGGRFRSKIDGRVIVESSRQPFVDSARVLIGEGCDPSVALHMKHTGSDVVALRAPLGKAARLSVEEGPNGPRFVPFRKDPKPCVDAPPAASGASPASLPSTKVRA